MHVHVHVYMYICFERAARQMIAHVDKSVTLVKYCINNRINKLMPRLYVGYDVSFCIFVRSL